MQLNLARYGALAAALAVAACVPSPPQRAPAPAPSVTPAPTPAPAATRAPVSAPLPTPAISATWHDAPATPGDWTYGTAATSSFADFRSPAGGQIFQIACAADRNLTLAVIARVPGANAITIRTEHFDRALSAGAVESSVSAVLIPTDPLLDAMAFSKGRFAVEVAGGPQLYLPAYPEVTRVIEDCRG